MYDLDRQYWQDFTSGNSFIWSLVPEYECESFEQNALVRGFETPDLGNIDQRWGWMSKHFDLWKISERVNKVNNLKHISELQQNGDLSLTHMTLIVDRCLQGVPTIPPGLNPHESKIITTNIPTWIKTNAGWWAENTIDDKAFVAGIQFLIKEGIMHMPDNTQSSPTGSSQEIPLWIKNNADWWSKGLISDDDFLKGIQFMVENGIITITTQKLTESESFLESESKVQSQIKQSSKLENTDKNQITNTEEIKIGNQEGKIPETKGTENLSIINYEVSRPVARGVFDEVLISGKVEGFNRGDKINAVIQDPSGQIEEHHLLSGDGTYRLPFLVYNDTEKGEYKITIKHASQQYQNSFFVE